MSAIVRSAAAAPTLAVLVALFIATTDAAPRRVVVAAKSLENVKRQGGFGWPDDSEEKRKRDAEEVLQRDSDDAYTMKRKRDGEESLERMLGINGMFPAPELRRRSVSYEEVAKRRLEDESDNSGSGNGDGDGDGDDDYDDDDDKKKRTGQVIRREVDDKRQRAEAEVSLIATSRRSSADKLNNVQSQLKKRNKAEAQLEKLKKAFKRTIQFPSVVSRRVAKA